MKYKNIDDICIDIDLWRSYAIKITKDRDTANEILSEFLEQMIHLYIKYPEKILHKAYIYQTLESRYNKRFEKPSNTIEYNDWMELAEDDYDVADDELETDRIDFISKEINHSPTKELWFENKVFLLIYQDGFSQCELARRSKIDRSSIKRALVDAKARFEKNYNNRNGKN